MSQATVYEWCEQFREGRELVANEAHGHIRPTAVTPVNIACVEQLILQNRQVIVRDIAAEVNISVGSVETIIHEHLRFRKVCARWVPRQLTFDQKWTRMKVSEQLLNQFRAEDGEFLQSVITCDETWLHIFTPLKTAWSSDIRVPCRPRKAKRNRLLHRAWELYSGT